MESISGAISVEPVEVQPTLRSELRSAAQQEKFFQKWQEAFDETENLYEAFQLAQEEEFSQEKKNRGAWVDGIPDDQGYQTPDTWSRPIYRSEVRLTERQEAELQRVEKNFGPVTASYVKMAILFFSNPAKLGPEEKDSRYVAEKYAEDWQRWQTEFAAIEGNAPLKALAQNAVVRVLSLDGGLGEKLGRQEWKAWLVKKGLLSEEAVERDPNGIIKLGAKGTDMGVLVKANDGTVYYVSASEAKLLQLYRKGLTREFSGLGFRPIVNGASKGSYEALLDEPNLVDIMKGVAKPRTYRELLASAGVTIEDFLFQPKVPGLREEADGTLMPASEGEYTQEGGHGQIGHMIVGAPETYQPRQDGKPDIVAFTNGDNMVSSDIVPEIVGDMIQHKRMIGNLVTPATRVDRKGGKYIVKLLEFMGLTKWVPGQREEAAAKGLGREALENFYKAGQPEGESIFGDRSSGKQPFNTNNFYIDMARVMPFLADLKKVMGEEGYLLQVISPNFMKKDLKDGTDGRKYYPIDSAIGNVFHNINEFVMQMTLIAEAAKDGKVALTEDQKAVLEVFTRHGVTEVIHYYNVPRRKFTPQKNPFDALMQLTGKYYRMSLAETDLGALREAGTGLVPPEVTIKDAAGNLQESGKGHYSEFLNMLGTFVTTESPETILNSTFDITRLDQLEIDGNIAVRDAIWAGDVTIINQDKSGQVFDLGAAILANDTLKKQLSYKEGQPLWLGNVKITVSADHQVTVETSFRRSKAILPPTAPSPQEPAISYPYDEKVIEPIYGPSNELKDWIKYTIRHESPSSSEYVVGSLTHPTDDEIRRNTESRSEVRKAPEETEKPFETLTPQSQDRLLSAKMKMLNAAEGLFGKIQGISETLGWVLLTVGALGGILGFFIAASATAAQGQLRPFVIWLLGVLASGLGVWGLMSLSHWMEHMSYRMANRIQDIQTAAAALELKMTTAAKRRESPTLDLIMTKAPEIPLSNALALESKAQEILASGSDFEVVFHPSEFTGYGPDREIGGYEMEDPNWYPPTGNSGVGGERPSKTWIPGVIVSGDPIYSPSYWSIESKGSAGEKARSEIRISEKIVQGMALDRDVTSAAQAYLTADDQYIVKEQAIGPTGYKSIAVLNNLVAAKNKAADQLFETEHTLAKAIVRFLGTQRFDQYWGKLTGEDRTKAIIRDLIMPLFGSEREWANGKIANKTVLGYQRMQDLAHQISYARSEMRSPMALALSQEAATQWLLQNGLEGRVMSFDDVRSSRARTGIATPYLPEVDHAPGFFLEVEVEDAMRRQARRVAATIETLGSAALRSKGYQVRTETFYAPFTEDGEPTAPAVDSEPLNRLIVEIRPSDPLKPFQTSPIDLEDLSFLEDLKGIADHPAAREAHRDRLQKALADLQPKWWDGLFNDNGTARKQNALEELGTLADFRAVPVMIKFLNDARFAEAATAALKKINDPWAHAALANHANKTLLSPEVEKMNAQAADLDRLPAGEDIPAKEPSRSEVRLSPEWEKTVLNLREAADQYATDKDFSLVVPEILRGIANALERDGAPSDEDSFEKMFLSSKFLGAYALYLIFLQQKSHLEHLKYKATYERSEMRDTFSISFGPDAEKRGWDQYSVYPGVTLKTVRIFTEKDLQPAPEKNTLPMGARLDRIIQDPTSLSGAAIKQIVVAFYKDGKAIGTATLSPKKSAEVPGTDGALNINFIEGKVGRFAKFETLSRSEARLDPLWQQTVSDLKKAARFFLSEYPQVSEVLSDVADLIGNNGAPRNDDAFKQMFASPDAPDAFYLYGLYLEYTERARANASKRSEVRDELASKAVDAMREAAALFNKIGLLKNTAAAGEIPGQKWTSEQIKALQWNDILAIPENRVLALTLEQIFADMTAGQRQWLDKRVTGLLSSSRSEMRDVQATLHGNKLTLSVGEKSVTADILTGAAESVRKFLKGISIKTSPGERTTEQEFLIHTGKEKIPVSLSPANRRSMADELKNTVFLALNTARSEAREGELESLNSQWFPHRRGYVASSYFQKTEVTAEAISKLAELIKTYELLITLFDNDKGQRSSGILTKADTTRGFTLQKISDRDPQPTPLDKVTHFKVERALRRSETRKTVEIPLGGSSAFRGVTVRPSKELMRGGTELPVTFTGKNVRRGEWTLWLEVGAKAATEIPGTDLRVRIVEVRQGTAKLELEGSPVAGPEATGSPDDTWKIAEVPFGQSFDFHGVTLRPSNSPIHLTEGSILFPVVFYGDHVRGGSYLNWFRADSKRSVWVPGTYVWAKIVGFEEGRFLRFQLEVRSNSVIDLPTTRSEMRDQGPRPDRRAGRDVTRDLKGPRKFVSLQVTGLIVVILGALGLTLGGWPAGLLGFFAGLASGAIVEGPLNKWGTRLWRERILGYNDPRFLPALEAWLQEIPEHIYRGVHKNLNADGEPVYTHVFERNAQWDEVRAHIAALKAMETAGGKAASRSELRGTIGVSIAGIGQALDNLSLRSVEDEALILFMLALFGLFGVLSFGGDLVRAARKALVRHFYWKSSPWKLKFSDLPAYLTSLDAPIVLESTDRSGTLSRYSVASTPQRYWTLQIEGDWNKEEIRVRYGGPSEGKDAIPETSHEAVYRLGEDVEAHSQVLELLVFHSVRSEARSAAKSHEAQLLKDLQGSPEEKFRPSFILFIAFAITGLSVGALVGSYLGALIGYGVGAIGFVLVSFIYDYVLRPGSRWQERLLTYDDPRVLPLLEKMYNPPTPYEEKIYHLEQDVNGDNPEIKTVYPTETALDKKIAERIAHLKSLKEKPARAGADLTTPHATRSEARSAASQEKQFQKALRDIRRTWIEYLFPKEGAERRVAAAEKLGRYNGPQAVAALTQALKDPRPEVKVAVLKALERVNDPRTVPALNRLVKDHDLSVRSILARTLGNTGVSQAAPALIDLLKKDRVPHVRAQAARALLRIDDPRVDPALDEAAATDKNYYVRKAAEQTLFARIGFSKPGEADSKVAPESRSEARVSVSQMERDLRGPRAFSAAWHDVLALFGFWAGISVPGMLEAPLILATAGGLFGLGLSLLLVRGLERSWKNGWHDRMLAYDNPAFLPHLETWLKEIPETVSGTSERGGLFRTTSGTSAPVPNPERALVLQKIEDLRRIREKKPEEDLLRVANAVPALVSLLNDGTYRDDAAKLLARMKDPRLESLQRYFEWIAEAELFKKKTYNTLTAGEITFVLSNLQHGQATAATYEQTEEVSHNAMNYDKGFAYRAVTKPAHLTVTIVQPGTSRSETRETKKTISEPGTSKKDTLASGLEMGLVRRIWDRFVDNLGYWPRERALSESFERNGPVFWPTAIALFFLGAFVGLQVFPDSEGDPVLVGFLSSAAVGFVRLMVFVYNSLRDIFDSLKYAIQLRNIPILTRKGREFMTAKERAAYEEREAKERAAFEAKAAELKTKWAQGIIPLINALTGFDPGEAGHLLSEINDPRLASLERYLKYYKTKNKLTEDDIAVIQSKIQQGRIITETYVELKAKGDQGIIQLINALTDFDYREAGHLLSEINDPRLADLKRYFDYTGTKNKLTENDIAIIRSNFEKGFDITVTYDEIPEERYQTVGEPIIEEVRVQSDEVGPNTYLVWFEELQEKVYENDGSFWGEYKTLGWLKKTIVGRRPGEWITTREARLIAHIVPTAPVTAVETPAIQSSTGETQGKTRAGQGSTGDDVDFGADSTTSRSESREGLTKKAVGLSMLAVLLSETLQASPWSAVTDFARENPFWAWTLGIGGAIGVLVGLYYAAWRIFAPISWFIWRLDSYDWDVRAYSKQKLAAKGAQAVPSLLKALNKKNGPVTQVINVLGEIKDDRSFNPLVQQLEGGEGAAAYAIANFPITKSIPTLIQALENNKGNAANTAVKVLKEFKNRDVVTALNKTLATPLDPKFAYHAVDVLDSYLDPSSVEPLIKALSTHSDSSVRKKIASILNRYKDPDATKIILVTLGDKDPEVSDHVASLFISRNDMSLVPALNTILLTSPQASARAQAAKVLSHYKNLKSADAFIKALSDKDQTVRKYAAEIFVPWATTLDAARKAQAANELEKLAQEDPSETIREQAVFTLGKLRDVRVVDTLIGLFRDPKQSPNLRSKAAAAIGEIGDQRGVQPLIEALTDKEMSVRISAAGGLDSFKVPEAVDPLNAALLEIAPAVSAGMAGAVMFRTIALNTLANIGSPAVPVILNFLNSQSDEVLYMVASTLLKANDPRLVDLRKYFAWITSSIDRSARWRGPTFNILKDADIAIIRDNYLKGLVTEATYTETPESSHEEQYDDGYYRYSDTVIDSYADLHIEIVVPKPDALVESPTEKPAVVEAKKEPASEVLVTFPSDASEIKEETVLSPITSQGVDPKPVVRELPEPYIPDVPFWDFQMPSVDESYDGMNVIPIRQALTGMTARNWLWRYFSGKDRTAYRQQVLERIGAVRSRIAAAMVMLSENQIISKTNPVVSVSLMGSYPWVKAPNDLDLVVVVGGERSLERISSEQLAAGARSVIPGLATSIEVVGLETLRRAAKGEDFEWAKILRRKLISYSGAIPLTGIDLFRGQKIPFENYAVMRDDLTINADRASWPEIRGDEKKIAAKREWRKTEIEALAQWLEGRSEEILTGVNVSVSEELQRAEEAKDLAVSGLIAEKIREHQAAVERLVQEKTEAHREEVARLVQEQEKAHQTAIDRLRQEQDALLEQETAALAETKNLEYRKKAFETVLARVPAYLTKLREVLEAMRPLVNKADLTPEETAAALSEAQQKYALSAEGVRLLRSVFETAATSEVRSEARAPQFIQNLANDVRVAQAAAAYLEAYAPERELSLMKDISAADNAAWNKAAYALGTARRNLAQAVFDHLGTDGLYRFFWDSNRAASIRRTKTLLVNRLFHDDAEWRTWSPVTLDADEALRLAVAIWSAPSSRSEARQKDDGKDQEVLRETANAVNKTNSQIGEDLFFTGAQALQASKEVTPPSEDAATQAASGAERSEVRKDAVEPLPAEQETVSLASLFGEGASVRGVIETARQVTDRIVAVAVAKAKAYLAMARDFFRD
ncbi:MAG: HEAT repeat domain-containing protein, partial [Candidatus Omnitrophica bacterium]|nr:HEAT repeat domain-containing protein [Candidatus Omnitrophota bacterium]